METLENRTATPEITMSVLLTDMQAGFAMMNDKFAKIDDRFAKMDDRFAKMDDRFTKMDDRFTEMDNRLEKMDLKIDTLSAYTTSGFKSLEAYTASGFKNLEAKIDDLKKEIFKINEVTSYEGIFNNSKDLKKPS